jgi:hypothetical protein
MSHAEIDTRTELISLFTSENDPSRLTSSLTAHRSNGLTTVLAISSLGTSHGSSIVRHATEANVPQTTNNAGIHTLFMAFSPFLA